MDLYFRLKLGQFRRLPDIFEGDKHFDWTAYSTHRQTIEALLQSLAALLGFKHELGVGSPQLTTNDCRAYEIYKVVDHALFKTRHPNPDKDLRWSVSNDDPYLLRYSGDPRIPYEIER